ncbi:hypothetical protein NPIL_49801 [Nephila pilipes]|uniref:SH3 domain-containing protein n=1 Tax=Nephila pilipes TaxID=299642 RepID=A0A8X6Q7I5_NEPPI|nr:hypothetical protein NPIL_49801 [Nephila pilipes]
MAEIAFYRSQYKYVKGDDSEISLEVGDILEVKKPFQFTLEGTEENPEGWILGRNQRTNECGYFPGTFVEYLRTEVLAPPTPVPQRPVPRPEPVIRNIEESNDSGYVGSPAIAAHLIKRSYNQHSLIKVYFLTPVLCRHLTCELIKLLMNPTSQIQSLMRLALALLKFLHVNAQPTEDLPMVLY